MKKSLKTMLGVTLLEIMLVLAIAGIVIAMSVRYYQQASNNQKITAGMSAMTAMVAAVEQYKLLGKTLTGISNDDLTTYFPGGTFPVSPWTAEELEVNGISTTQYTVTMKTSDATACSLFKAQMDTQPGYKTDCGGSSTAVVTVGTTTAAPPPNG